MEHNMQNVKLIYGIRKENFLSKGRSKPTNCSPKELKKWNKILG